MSQMHCIILLHNVHLSQQFWTLDSGWETMRRSVDGSIHSWSGEELLASLDAYSRVLNGNVEFGIMFGQRTKLTEWCDSNWAGHAILTRSQPEWHMLVIMKKLTLYSWTKNIEI